MALFLDASAVVKYYATEPGSAFVRQKVDSGAPVLLGEITLAEVAAALGILRRTGRISPGQRQRFWERFARDVVERFTLVPVPLSIIHMAAGYCAVYPLKAYDSVQLAVAVASHRKLTERQITVVFITGDSALLDAAENEGLPVENPFWHVDLDG